MSTYYRESLPPLSSLPFYNSRFSSPPTTVHSSSPPPRTPHMISGPALIRLGDDDEDWHGDNLKLPSLKNRRYSPSPSDSTEPRTSPSSSNRLPSVFLSSVSPSPSPPDDGRKQELVFTPPRSTYFDISSERGRWEYESITPYKTRIQYRQMIKRASEPTGELPVILPPVQTPVTRRISEPAPLPSIRSTFGSYLGRPQNDEEEELPTCSSPVKADVRGSTEFDVPPSSSPTYSSAAVELDREMSPLTLPPSSPVMSKFEEVHSNHADETDQMQDDKLYSIDRLSTGSSNDPCSTEAGESKRPATLLDAPVSELSSGDGSSPIVEGPLNESSVTLDEEPVQPSLESISIKDDSTLQSKPKSKSDVVSKRKRAKKVEEVDDMQPKKKRRRKVDETHQHRRLPSTLSDISLSTIANAPSLTRSSSSSNSDPSPSTPRPESHQDESPPDSELLGLLIESLATSRSSSLSVTSLYSVMTSSRPSLKDQKNRDEWLDVILDVLIWGWRAGDGGLFGRVESSRTDDADRSYEARWFYIPEGDEDQERATLVKSMMTRPGKRNVTKNYKQYYYRPLAKISRWDAEDDL